MVSELYEIVRADKLKVGDRIEWNGMPQLTETIIDIQFENGFVFIDTGNTYMKWSGEMELYRRYTGMSLEVLMRVVDILHSEIASGNANKYFPRETDPIASYIELARRELEQERTNERT